MRNRHQFCCLLLIMSAVPFAAQKPAPEHVPWLTTLGYSAAEVHELSVGRFGLPYVESFINDKKVVFVFDTANMNGLAVSPAVARDLHLRSVSSAEALDASGASLGSRHVFNVERFSVLGKTWSSQRAIELGNNSLDGLIGPRYVRDGRFSLDYRRGVLAFADTILPINATGTTLPLVASAALPGMLVISGEVNGRTVLIQIDTGKSRTCVDKTLAKEQKLSPTNNGYHIKNIRIGAWHFSVESAREEDFRGISSDLPSPILLGIGSDVLPQVVMTVDYPRQVVNLLPQDSDPSTF